MEVACHRTQAHPLMIESHSPNRAEQAHRGATRREGSVARKAEGVEFLAGALGT